MILSNERRHIDMRCKMKKLPLGIQGFKEIIDGNYVYIDKTQYVYNLINSAKYFFLSRPRRFGKSLLIDTINEVFNGDKDLFNGLWIYNSDYDFTQYPVIRLDMSNIANKTADILENSLSIALMDKLSDDGLIVAGDTPSDKFKFYIKALYNKYNKRVVVLIDEYDKPILDHLDDIEIAESNRKVLRGFYGVLKSMDQYLKFSFITGVSKFARTSIFSELNNLLDITLTKEYSNICGITTEDFSRHFSDHIENLSILDDFKHCENLHDEILAWYDGYSWDGKTRVINPFSLLSFFVQKRFGSFWYVSGSPKFLMDLIKKDPGAYTNLKNLKITEFMLDSPEIHNIDTELLLFQSGYLTINEVIATKGAPVYVLGIPNNEVKEALSQACYLTK